jgi:hypothetical protein
MRSRNHAALPHFFFSWTPGPEARFETAGEKSAQLASRLRIGIRILEQSPHWKCFDRSSNRAATACVLAIVSEEYGRQIRPSRLVV